MSYSTSPRPIATNKSLQAELRRHVSSAIELFKEVMDDKTAKTSERLVAAGKLVDAYLKIDKRIDESSIMEQQKRMNALRINKETADANSTSAGYKSLGMLDFEPAAFS
jgi:hypothetical protein